MSPPKVLVVGLDSADRNCISRWSDAGDLPVLRSLRDRAASGILTTPPALGDDAAWASFYTAVSPGRHGRYHHRQLRTGSYEVDNFRDARREPFWDALSRAGKRVAVLDVPKSPLSKDLNGFQVTDWLVHGRDYPTKSFPPAIGRDLLQRFGDDQTDRWPEGACLAEALSEAQRETFVEHLLSSLEKKTSAVLELLQRDAWDMFLVVFKEAHCAAHHLWPRVGSRRPGQQAASLPPDESPVKRIYQALDAALGRVLASVDSTTNVIVFSDLGMAANVTGEHLLDDILLRLDGSIPLSIWQRLESASKRWGYSRTERSVAWVNRKLYPYRKAFQLEHNEISGAVRINLKGREPHGVISPGPNCKAFLDQLSQDLLNLVNPDSGHPVVRQVVRTDELFPGEFRHLLPDLFVVWNRIGPITAAASPKIGEVRLPSPHWRPANHVPDGFFFAYGPQVLLRGKPESVSIMDLAPSIARLLGVSLSNIDGRCLPCSCDPPASP